MFFESYRKGGKQWREVNLRRTSAGGSPFQTKRVKRNASYARLPLMLAHEQDIRELATRSPFVPFTVVTASGERYAVKHHDFILFMPTIDEITLEPLPEEERPRYFIVAGKGNRQRWVFWDSVTAID